MQFGGVCNAGGGINSSVWLASFTGAMAPESEGARGAQLLRKAV